MHQCTPRIVVNIGVCGRKKHISTQWVQIYRIQHLGNKKEALCPIYTDIFPLQSIGCSDTIITHEADMYEETLVDMESFGIHFVCQKEKIPFLILKKPFDVVSPDSKHIQKETIIREVESIPMDMIWEKIEQFLDTLPPRMVDISPFIEKYRLTWSQGQKLQFAVHRAIARGETWENLFRKLSEKTPKEFEAFFIGGD